MTEDVIRRAAKVARIELKKEEGKQLALELAKILNWIGDLPKFEPETDLKYIKPRQDNPRPYPGQSKIVIMFPKRRGDRCLV